MNKDKFQKKFNIKILITFIFLFFFQQIQAATITVSSNTTWSAAANGCTPGCNSANDISVTSGILTLGAGTYYFNSLTLSGTASIVALGETTNYTGVIISVNTDITIPSGTSINANGKGATSYLSGAKVAGAAGSTVTASTGGGHGGSGGGVSYVVDVGIPFDSATGPIYIGSIGGPGTTPTATSAGPGGGAIKLVVPGTLSISGSISANGAVGTGTGSGGGSGGSIWLDAGTISGAGTLTANGGPAKAPTTSGGGSGGRIALYYSISNSFNTSGTITTTGGSGKVNGDEGTYFEFIKSTNDIRCNRNIRGGFDMLNQPALIHNIEISNGCRFSIENGDSTNSLLATGNVIIGTSSSLNVDGQGFKSTNAGGSLGTGAGISSSAAGYSASGGGYGGIGGYGKNVAGGIVYGSSTQPSDKGSAGGSYKTGSPVNAVGGFGGGALKLKIDGTLTVNGTLSSNGITGQAYLTTSVGGGGSGGSLWIDTYIIEGSGALQAIGGAVGSSVTYNPGTGGGGRIALYYSSANNFTGSVNVAGGSPGYFDNGKEGTYFEQNSSTGDVFCTRTIRGGFDSKLGAIYPIRNIVIGDFANSKSCSFTVENGQFGPLSASGNVNISYGSTINANGLGAGGNGAAGSGTGAGGSTTASAGGGGGGYGGVGYPGGGGSGGSGGITYGSVFQPIDLGSGGGNSTSGIASVSFGGAGGGALKLVITGSLTLSGKITSNGAIGEATLLNGTLKSGGGGSGGSLWIDVGSLIGSGSFEANGGSATATTNTGGVGGGGRIAIYSSDSSLFTGTGTANNGSGLVSGTVRGLTPPYGISFTISPTDGTGGVVLTQQPIVRATDFYASTDLTYRGSVSLTAYSCTEYFDGTNWYWSLDDTKPLSTSTVSNSPISFVNGVATFSTVSVNRINGGIPIALKATSGALINYSTCFTLSMGPASILSFTTQPSIPNTAGVAFTTVPKVTVKDLADDTITTYNTSINLSVYSDSGCSTSPVTSGVLSNSSTTPALGIGTFSGINYTLANTGSSKYYFKATSGSLATDCSTYFQIAAAAGSKLEFTSPPSLTGTAGVNLSQQPSVSLEDSYGNVINDTGTLIQLQPSSVVDCSSTASGGSLGGASAFTTNGVATYTGVNYTKSGIIYLKAVNGGMSTCSSSIDISPGAAANLAFTQQPPSTAKPTVNFSTQPIVGIQDSYGNIITSSSAAVSLLPYLNNTCTSLASGVLNQNETTTNGLANFSNVKYNLSEPIYLKASSGGLTDACSTGVNVSSGGVPMFFRGF